MYVVTAVDERPGPPAVPDGRGFHTSAARAPVGVQHAVPRLLGRVFQTVALCGAQVSGWAVFPEMPFAPERAASCPSRRPSPLRWKRSAGDLPTPHIASVR